MQITRYNGQPETLRAILSMEKQNFAKSDSWAGWLFLQHWAIPEDEIKKKTYVVDRK